MIYFLITLGLQLLIFLFDQIITIRYVNRLKKHYSSMESVKHLSLQIDAQEWSQMIQESIHKTLFERLESTYGFISENGILLSGVFIWILDLSKKLVHLLIFGNQVLSQYSFLSDNLVIWQGVMFLFLVSLFSSICKAPFEIYRVFVVEDSWADSFWNWLLAQLKMGFLAVVIGSPLLSLILWLINIGGGEQWVYIWVGAGALSVGIFELYPSVLLPLFFNISLTKSSVMEDHDQEENSDEYEPNTITDGEMKKGNESVTHHTGDGSSGKNDNHVGMDHIHDEQQQHNGITNNNNKESYFSRSMWNPFFRKLGIKDNNWQVVVVEHEDIVNAYTVEKSGVLWIVVYSPLLELSVEEVQAVIAHEVCHYQHRHSAWTIGLHLFSLGVFLFLFSQVAYRQEFYASFGFDEVDTGVGLCLFSYLYSPVASLINMISNCVQRSWEFQCDVYAQENGTNIREALISMCDLNAGVDSICGNGMWSVYNRQHPSLLERIEWLDQVKTEK